MYYVHLVITHSANDITTNNCSKLLLAGETTKNLQLSSYAWTRLSAQLTREAVLLRRLDRLSTKDIREGKRCMQALDIRGNKYWSAGIYERRWSIFQVLSFVFQWQQATLMWTNLSSLCHYSDTKFQQNTGTEIAEKVFLFFYFLFSFFLRIHCWFQRKINTQNISRYRYPNSYLISPALIITREASPLAKISRLPLQS